jgi:hypothetical protein
MTYQIPKILWESFESVLYAESRNYLRSMADVLKVNSNDLIKAVLPSKDSLKVLLYETDEIHYCKAFIPHPARPDLAIHCRKPVFPGEDWCNIHQHARHGIQKTIEKTEIWRSIKVPPELPALWLNEKDQVVNADGIVCGIAKKQLDESGEIIIKQIIFYDRLPGV